MIVIMRDAVMPDCCNTCVCSEGYGCGITGTVMTTKEMEERPDWCPLEEQEPCEDTISRQAAIDEIKSVYEWHDTVTVDRLIQHFKALPSAQPEPPEECERCMMEHTDEMEKLEAELAMAQPKRGKWERHYSRPNVYADLCWHCSECGYRSSDNWADKFNFCPNCGADMRGEQDENR